MSRWEVTDVGAAIHVVPLDDLIEHERSSSCTCAPKVRELGTTCWGHGPTGKLAVRKEVVHEAMDGRE